MARFTRRGFIAASGALAAAPALSALKAQAQGPQPPDIGNLRAERDIVFAKAGTMDLKLDVYQPPVGVTSKRTAIIHLFGGGFWRCFGKVWVLARARRKDQHQACQQ